MGKQTGIGGRRMEKTCKRKDYVNLGGTYIKGSPIGYYEIELTTDLSSKIHYIGLIKSFIGKGLGGSLLSHAIDQAWKTEAKKVILNICSHDHPHAISNYLNRGFTIKDKSKSPANPKRKSNFFKFTIL